MLNLYKRDYTHKKRSQLNEKKLRIFNFVNKKLSVISQVQYFAKIPKIFKSYAA